MNLLLHELRGAIVTLLVSGNTDGKCYNKKKVSYLYIAGILQRTVTVGHPVKACHNPCALRLLQLDSGCLAFRIGCALQMSQLELNCLASDFLHALLP